MCPPLDVSVVIPTYNRADWLPKTLAAVLEQTLEPMEVIVVDDGSTDGTAALARSFPPPVKYSRIENSGVCCARNVGMSLARGAWLAFCDSDDLWHPRKLEAQARLLQSAPGLEFAFNNFRAAVPPRARGRSLRLKGLIAALPPAIDRALRRLSLAVAARLRRRR